MESKLIYIEDIEQYLALITLIEDYNRLLPKKVTYLGKPNHIVPTQEQLDAPYTKYILKENRLWADGVIFYLLEENSIKYTIIEL